MLLFLFHPWYWRQISNVPDDKDVGDARKALTTTSKKVVTRQESAVNKYCTCTEETCNCCREFRVPILNINGPGK